MNGKFLGKISKATFGINSDNMFGLDLEFSFEGRGVNTSLIIPIKTTLKGLGWNTESQQFIVGLIAIFNAAKCSDVNKLVGTPIQVEIEQNTLKNWRILTEVL